MARMKKCRLNPLIYFSSSSSSARLALAISPPPAFRR